MNKTDAALATKLLKAKDPRKLLDKERGGRVTVWRLLASGALPFAAPFCNLAGSCAGDAPVATAIEAAARITPEAFRAEGAGWALGGSYRADAAAWEAAMATLPATAQDLLAPARAAAGVALPAADRERALEAYADLAFAGSGDPHYMADTVSDLEAKPAFHARVLRRLAARPDAELNSDIATALAAAPWPLVLDMVKRHGYRALRFYHFDEAMAAHDHTAAQHHEMLVLGEASIDNYLAQEIALRAVQRGEPMPPVEDVLADWLIEDGADTIEEGLVLEALPPKRYAALAKKIAASKTRAFGCAGILRDASLDDEIVDALAGAVDREDWSNTYSSLDRPLKALLPARTYAIGLIDRAWERLTEDGAFGATYIGRRLALLFGRVKFKLSRGAAERPWDLVMPGAQLEWAEECGDLVGRDEPFTGLTDAEVERLFDAYAPLDWDGTLEVASTFRDRLPARVDAMVTPPIEERPWAELAALVAGTSFARLKTGENGSDTLTRLFARPEPLAERMALVAAIAEREAAHAAADPANLIGANALLLALQALAPHVRASAEPFPAAIAAAVERMQRHDLPDAYVEMLGAYRRDHLTSGVKGKKSKGVRSRAS